jgi:hypothetical protein
MHINFVILNLLMVFYFQKLLRIMISGRKMVLDLIFGDVRKFMTDEILSDHDFINVRHDYTTGVLALYKNTTLMNTFFM